MIKGGSFALRPGQKEERSVRSFFSDTECSPQCPRRVPPEGSQALCTLTWVSAWRCRWSRQNSARTRPCWGRRPLGRKGMVTHPQLGSPPTHSPGRFSRAFLTQEPHPTLSISVPLADAHAISWSYSLIYLHTVRTHSPSSASVSHNCRPHLREGHHCFQPILMLNVLRHPNSRCQVSPSDPTPTSREGVAQLSWHRYLPPATGPARKSELGK